MPNDVHELYSQDDLNFLEKLSPEVEELMEEVDDNYVMLYEALSVLLSKEQIKSLIDMIHFEKNKDFYEDLYDPANPNSY